MLSVMNPVMYEKLAICVYNQGKSQQTYISVWNRRQKKKAFIFVTTALVMVMLKPVWETKVEKASPILSPVLMYPNMMAQNERKVNAVVCIWVRTSMNTVAHKDAKSSRGSSFARKEKKKDVGLYPPSEISLYAISR